MLIIGAFQRIMVQNKDYKEKFGHIKNLMGDNLTKNLHKNRIEK